MPALAHDIRHAWHSLARAPAFTAVALLTLALGIGANLSIFSIVDAVLLRPPALVRQPERLVSVWTSDFSGPPYGASSFPDFEEIRAARDVFNDAAAYAPQPFSLARSGDVSERLFGEIVSANYFDLLGIRPALGRFFLPDEAGAAETHPIAVLGYGLWQRSFGGSADVVGQPIRVNGHVLTVVGVAPRQFRGSMRGLDGEIWVPFSAGMQGDDPPSRGNRGLFVLGRLRPGATAERAQARMDVLARQLHAQYPDFWTDVHDQSRRLTVLPERASRVPPMMRGPVLGFVALLMSVVGIVLLIACANIANLLLARATARRREVAVRLALGATRRQLVRQLLVESLVLGVAGAAAGVLLAVWVTGLLARFQPPIGVPLALDLGLDGRVLGFAAALAVLTAVAFGLAPALRATRLELVDWLKQEGPGVRLGRSRFGLRDLLVVAQVAGSLVLLLAGTLFLRSLQHAGDVNPGFDPQGVLLVSFDLGAEGYDEPRADAFYTQLRERAAALPGVTGAALAQYVPLSLDGARRSVRIEGYQKQAGEDLEFGVNTVGPGYFETMRVPLVEGRGFTAADRKGAPPVAVVNEAFARRFWPGENPIGKRIAFGADTSWAEVVGVTSVGKYGSLAEEPEPYFYIPWLQDGGTRMTLHLRAAGDPRALVPLVRREVRALAPQVPITGLTTMRESMGTSVLPQRIAAAMLGLFGVLALLLATVGLYGVVAYAVSRRTRELGIRMALGARAADIFGMVVRRGMALVAVGAVVGLALSLVATRFLRGFLFGVGATDPVTFVGVPLLLALVALLASCIPARRAMRVDPVVALRSE